jgi:tetratricopeptide (TPR) repeat protein
MRILLCMIIVVGLVGLARPSAADSNKARELFRQAQTKYNLLHFDEALALFEKGYEEKPDPVFLFNIAQCQRQLGRYELAAKSYRAYLVQQPDAPNRDDVLARIADMEKAAQEKRAAAPPEGVKPPVETPTPEAPPAATPTEPAPPVVATTPAEPSHRPRTLTIVGAVLTGVGGAALIGGLASGLVAKSDSDAVAADARNHAEFDPSKESAGTAAANASYALYAIGGAAAVTGVVLLVLDWRAHRHGERAGLRLELAHAVTR